MHLACVALVRSTAIALVWTSARGERAGTLMVLAWIVFLWCSAARQTLAPHLTAVASVPDQ